MKRNRLKEKNWILRTLFSVIICLGIAMPGFAQTKTIKGTVSDASTGDPIIAASVNITGTQRGMLTDAKGGFSLEASPNETLTISYLGYVTQKVNIGTKTNFDIRMEMSQEMLDEVVISVGYGTQKKVSMTGSVATVSNKDITVTKNENIINSLAGKLPGVRITQKSSQPGAYDTQIDIRGMGTPLIVVDGVPRDRDYFARMDPEEIEDVTVLKDGTAAIYGLRAANGVMLITTKSGTDQKGKVDISYTSNFTFQQFLYVPEAVNAIEYYTLLNEQNWQDFGGNYLVLRTAARPYDTYIKPFVTGEKHMTNWMDEVFKKTTPQQQHSLSINGGSDKLRYFLSMTYFRQDGNLRSGDMWDERFNLRSNLDAQITKRLKARVSIGAIMGTTENPRTSWTLYKDVWLTKSAASVYANNNPMYYNGDPTELQDGHNPVAETQKKYAGYNRNLRRQMNGGLTLTYDIPGIKGLSARGMYNYSTSMPFSQSYGGQYYLYQYDAAKDVYTPNLRGSNPAWASRGSDFSYDTNMQLGLNYANKFGGHSVSSFLTFEENYNSWGNSISATRELFVNSDQISVGEDANQKGSGNSPAERLNQAIIGQLAYDYQGKYLAMFAFRYDGSSRYPKGARWGFFPTYQVGWRLSEESFLKDNVDFLSNLKLKASYGEMGDDSAAGNYPPIYSVYSTSNDRGWYYNTESALTQGLSYPGITNPNLTWYKSIMYNAGVEVSLLKNKFGGTFELWRRDRSGLLATNSTVIPGTVGASLPQENMNSDRRFGWDLSLDHGNTVGNVRYKINAVVSGTKGMRLDWKENPANNSRDHWRNRQSGRYSDIWWTRKMGGMWTSLEQIRSSKIPVGQGTLPGDWYETDWNGDGVFNGDDDYPYAVYGLPVFNGGINTAAAWKDFDLALNFQYAVGVYAAYSEVLTEALPFGGANGLKMYMDRWHPVDEEADKWASDTKWVEGYYPITGRDGRRTNSNNVNNTSYIRLKTLELGYTFPKPIMAKAGIKNLRIYVSGYNLLTFSALKYVDPERPGSSGGSSSDYIDFYSYPINRTYTVGLNIKF